MKEKWRKAGADPRGCRVGSLQRSVSAGACVCVFVTESGDLMMTKLISNFALNNFLNKQVPTGATTAFDTLTLKKTKTFSICPVSVLIFRKF